MKTQALALIQALQVLHNAHIDELTDERYLKHYRAAISEALQIELDVSGNWTNVYFNAAQALQYQSMLVWNKI